MLSPGLCTRTPIHREAIPEKKKNTDSPLRAGVRGVTASQETEEGGELRVVEAEAAAKPSAAEGGHPKAMEGGMSSAQPSSGSALTTPGKPAGSALLLVVPGKTEGWRRFDLFAPAPPVSPAHSSNTSVFTAFQRKPSSPGAVEMLHPPEFIRAPPGSKELSKPSSPSLLASQSPGSSAGGPEPKTDSTSPTKGCAEADG